MPRPRDPDITRIESDTYRRGYAREYKGQWVIFLGSRKIYTGLRPVPATIPKVKRRLDAEIEADMSGTTTAPVSVQSVPTLWEAVARWYDEHVEGNREMGETHRVGIRNAIKAFKGDRDVPLGAAPGVAAALADRIIRIKKERGFAANTGAQYLRIWKRIFAWCVASGWLLSNPIDLVKVPARQRKPREKRMFTTWELIGILRRARRMRYGEERYRVLVWLLLTGMRSREVLDMRWDHITRTPSGGWAIDVRGKGHKGQKRHRLLVIPPVRGTDSPRDRWASRLHAILEAQRKASAEWRHPERVWRWKETTNLRSTIINAKKDMGLVSGDRRMIHTFRAMTTHYLRHTLGFSRQYAALVCGHSERVQEESYDRDLDIQEHEKYLAEGDGSE